ncbi:hypothetical protein E1A91_D03G129300v1 [Gossypium mustelinum]|uniref:Uncharacterized protein n=1 Tax=Gossypium mustelinum TaxID=34275 RepID=A0A5D2VMP9_GOSMU|nr:hypothetical protein E1A91_D03G129300v1 [Gossypium mustelinum]
MKICARTMLGGVLFGDLKNKKEMVYLCITFCIHL